jgi:hypothetical protein
VTFKSDVVVRKQLRSDMVIRYFMTLGVLSLDLENNRSVGFKFFYSENLPRDYSPLRDDNAQYTLIFHLEKEPHFKANQKAIDL